MISDSEQKQKSVTRDYSWIIWLCALVILVWLIFSYSSSNSINAQERNEEVASEFIEDIDYKYSSLVDDAVDLMGDIDEGCSWQYNEISKGVGTFCLENALMYYKDIQNNNHWRARNITYDKTAERNDILDSIADQANVAYSSLMEKAEDSLQAYRNQCGWISTNVGSSYGHECNGYINGFMHSSNEPFRASDYYDRT